MQIDIDLGVLAYKMIGEDGESARLMKFLDEIMRVIIRRYAAQSATASDQIDVFIDRMGGIDIIDCTPGTKLLLQKLSGRFPYQGT